MHPTISQTNSIGTVFAPTVSHLPCVNLQIIDIAAYNHSWDQKLVTIGTTLRLRLQNIALRIDHIGSTTEPRLTANYRMDIRITVSSILEFDCCGEGLEGLKYQEFPVIRMDNIPSDSDASLSALARQSWLD